MARKPHLAPIVKRDGFTQSIGVLYLLQSLLGVGMQHYQVAKRAFERHSKQIRDAAVLEAKESMSVAVEEIRQLNGCEGDELADIAINIDGTWMKRGHSSLYCAVFAISWQTDKVIDYAVLSKFCYECNYWEKQDEDL